MNHRQVLRNIGRPRYWRGAVLGTLWVVTGIQGPAPAQIVHEGQMFRVIPAERIAPSGVPTRAAQPRPVGPMTAKPSVTPEPSTSPEPSGSPAPSVTPVSASDGDADTFDPASAGTLSWDHGGESIVTGHEVSIMEQPFLHLGSGGHHGLGSRACRTCGPAGRFGGGGFGMPDGSGFTACDPFWYASVDALYLRRSGNRRFTLSDDFRLNRFGFDFAPRITAGIVPDCVNGFEASFTGVLDWDMSGSLASPTNELNSILRPNGITVPSDAMNTFQDAAFQSQRYASEFWSVEGSRVFHGWGISKFLYGVRYADLSESIRFSTINPVEGAGFFRSETENRMIGGQVGLDLMYPVARHAYADFRGRAGAYYNVVDMRFDVINAGERVVSARQDKDTLAGIFELGSGLRYQLGESLSIRGGFEVWYLTGVGTAREQIQNPIHTRFGEKVRTNDGVVIYGVNVGAEFRY